MDVESVDMEGPYNPDASSIVTAYRLFLTHLPGCYISPSGDSDIRLSGFKLIPALPFTTGVPHTFISFASSFVERG